MTALTLSGPPAIGATDACEVRGCVDTVAAVVHVAGPESTVSRRLCPVHWSGVLQLLAAPDRRAAR